MPNITPGNRLYLYRLFSRELGVGRQASLQRLDEVLEADGLAPTDLGCADARTLADALGPDMLKVTLFKKGRVVVTLVDNPEWDQALERADETDPEDKDKGSKQGGKPWKRKKGPKELKPQRPRHVKVEQPAPAVEPEPAAAEPAAAEPAAAQPEPEALVPVVAPAEAGTQPVAADPADVTPAGKKVAEPAAPEPAPSPAVAASAAPAPTAPEPAPEPELEPAAPEPATPVPAAPEPSIHFTITYDPTDDAEAGLREDVKEPATASVPAAEATPAVTTAPATATATAPAAPAATPAAAPQPAPVVSTPVPRPVPAPLTAEQLAPAPAPAAPSAQLQADLPQSVSGEVHCKDELLRVLYQLLPIDADPMATLDEDWRVARSTLALGGTRSRVTFPLRYLHSDGTPIEVTLKRSSRQTAGKRWSLALVDGDDGTGTAHEAVGIEGAPTRDQGAWADLSGRTGTVPAEANPLIELTNFSVLGRMDAMLGTLATMAAPERWDYPDEGVGKASRYGVLMEYLLVTFHRLRATGRVAVAADGSLAAFNTGLSTAFEQDIYAVFSPHAGDIPWSLEGFACAGSGELGARLAAAISPLPAPASYLTRLEDVLPDVDRMVILDVDGILTRQLGRLPHAFLTEQLEANTAVSGLLDQTLAAGPLTETSGRDLARAIKGDPGLYRRINRALDDAVQSALRRVRASYRVAVPVFDPTDNKVKQLVPLCLVDDGQADCALVLDPQPSGAYRGAAVLPLPRAYACARAISAEQPAWLAN